VSLLPAPPAVFAILSSLVEERSGLHYAPRDAELFLAKVSARALDGGFESLLDYYYFLRYDEGGTAELDALVDALVVHETYFFRESAALVTLIETHLAPAIRGGARPRVWCAAAATGEEPLTLSVLLAARGLLDAVEIVASDISERALALAQRGDFGGRSLRNIPSGYERWLQPAGDRLLVDPALTARISWNRINLVEPMPWPPGRFDAVLCRNVLIYFSPETAARVVERLTEQLAPGGLLLVGVSESLLAFGTLLSCQERQGAFFYEKVPR